MYLKKFNNTLYFFMISNDTLDNTQEDYSSNVLYGCRQIKIKYMKPITFFSSLQMKMSDLQLLALPCSSQLEILVRCGAGGRDHTPCCQRRGIRWECLPICSATMEMTPQAIVSTCIGDAGKIIQVNRLIDCLMSFILHTYKFYVQGGLSLEYNFIRSPLYFIRELPMSIFHNYSVFLKYRLTLKIKESNYF